MRSWQICLSSSRVSCPDSRENEFCNIILLSNSVFVVDFKAIARLYIIRNKSFECNLKANMKFCSKLNYLQLKEAKFETWSVAIYLDFQGKSECNSFSRNFFFK